MIIEHVLKSIPRTEQAEISANHVHLPAEIYNDVQRTHRTFEKFAKEHKKLSKEAAAKVSFEFLYSFKVTDDQVLIYVCVDWQDKNIDFDETSKHRAIDSYVCTLIDDYIDMFESLIKRQTCIKEDRPEDLEHIESKLLTQYSKELCNRANKNIKVAAQNFHRTDGQSVQIERQQDMSKIVGKHVVRDPTDKELMFESCRRTGYWDTRNRYFIKDPTKENDFVIDLTHESYIDYHSKFEKYESYRLHLKRTETGQYQIISLAKTQQEMLF